jgi:ribosomal protein S18 acetylase RimI-like enzyme
MNEYIIRQATLKDIEFLADVVIGAEKSNSDKLSYSTLFNLPEKKVKELIIAMFDEEIDGCEFSVSSYLITEYNGVPAAGFSAWVEGLIDNIPSKVLKANLINYTFDAESKAFLQTKAHMIKPILSEREPLTLQYEYLMVTPEHRGKHLANGLINKLEEYALAAFPDLTKAQVQVFKNNTAAIKTYQNNGFEIVKSYKATDPAIFDYLPFDEKLIMEKKIK